MLRFLVPLIFVASARSIAFPAIIQKFSAASPAQIRFAIENKFDDTGPGAKEPEYAYKTYQSLDDALVAYVNDPDTQLPQYEKARAIANLYKHKHEAPPRDRLKTLPIILNSYSKFDDAKYSDCEVVNELKEPFRWPKEQTRMKENPGFVSSEFKPYYYQYRPHPEVEFSIDVHDKETGDLKTAQELRDGSGTVHGYYTIFDNDGRRRTVHYQSNPSRGYRSSVQRTY